MSGRYVLIAVLALLPLQAAPALAETYFEKPHALRRRYPELYELLREFYGLEPAAWA